MRILELVDLTESMRQELMRGMKESEGSSGDMANAIRGIKAMIPSAKKITWNIREANGGLLASFEG
jgi:hypothetical protein